MAKREKTLNSDKTSSLTERAKQAREHDDQAASALSRLWESEEAAASKYNRMIRELRNGEHWTQEGEDAGKAPTSDIQKLTIGEETYDLTLSEEYLGLIKVEGLRSSHLKTLHRDPDDSKRLHVKVEWAGQTFEAPLNEFENLQGAQSQAPSGGEGFVKAMPYRGAVSPKSASSEKERGSQERSSAFSADRPVPKYRIEIGGESVIEFRIGMTKKGHVYLYLLRM